MLWMGAAAVRARRVGRAASRIERLGAGGVSSNG